MEYKFLEILVCAIRRISWLLTLKNSRVYIHIHE